MLEEAVYDVMGGERNERVVVSLRTIQTQAPFPDLHLHRFDGSKSASPPPSLGARYLGARYLGRCMKKQLAKAQFDQMHVMSRCCKLRVTEFTIAIELL
jgi:hypothetical protein